jgi:hypothetical protein
MHNRKDNRQDYESQCTEKDSLPGREVKGINWMRREKTLGRFKTRRKRMKNGIEDAQEGSKKKKKKKERNLMENKESEEEIEVSQSLLALSSVYPFSWTERGKERHTDSFLRFLDSCSLLFLSPNSISFPDITCLSLSLSFRLSMNKKTGFLFRSQDGRLLQCILLEFRRSFSLFIASLRDVFARFTVILVVLLSPHLPHLFLGSLAS